VKCVSLTPHSTERSEKGGVVREGEMCKSDPAFVTPHSDLTIRAVTRDVDPHTLTFTKSCTYWCGWSVGTQGGK